MFKTIVLDKYYLFSSDRYSLAAG